MRDPRRLILATALLALLPAGPGAAGEGEYAAAVKAVQAATDGKDPGPLADALYGLRSFDGAPASRVLLSAGLRREVPDFVLDGAMDAFAEFRSDEAVEVLVGEASRSKGALLLHCLEALGRIRNPRAGEAILGRAEDPDPRIRTAAVRALADGRDPSTAARAAAERAAADPDPRVRSAGIDALAGWKASRGALPILARLPLEGGRLFEDAWRGLLRISGQNLPPVPEKWADWWRTFPGEEKWHFDAPPPDPPRPSLELAGLVTWSRRVVLALDTSEGMADAPGYRPEAFLPEEVLKEGGKTLEEWRGIRTRLDHARCRILRAIAGLPPDAAFDLHFGGETSAAVFRGCEPASAAGKDQASGRLRGLNGRGRQDFLRLVRGALAGDPEGDPLSPEAFLEGPDTVVYVGTALPSFGAEKDTGRILSTLRRWNRVRQVRFLCVGVGNHGSDLLGGLASLRPVGAASAIE